MCGRGRSSTCVPGVKVQFCGVALCGNNCCSGVQGQVWAGMWILGAVLQKDPVRTSLLTVDGGGARKVV